MKTKLFIVLLIFLVSSFCFCKQANPARIGAQDSFHTHILNTVSDFKASSANRTQNTNSTDIKRNVENKSSYNTNDEVTLKTKEKKTNDNQSEKIKDKELANDTIANVLHIANEEVKREMEEKLKINNSDDNLSDKDSSIVEESVDSSIDDSDADTSQTNNQQTNYEEGQFKEIKDKGITVNKSSVDNKNKDVKVKPKQVNDVKKPISRKVGLDSSSLETNDDNLIEKNFPVTSVGNTKEKVEESDSFKGKAKETEQVKNKNFLKPKRNDSDSLQRKSSAENNEFQVSIDQVRPNTSKLLSMYNIKSFSQAVEYLGNIQIDFNQLIEKQTNSDYPKAVTVYSQLIIPFLQVFPFAAGIVLLLLVFFHLAFRLFNKEEVKSKKNDLFIVFKAGEKKVLSQPIGTLNSPHNFHPMYEKKNSLPLKGRKKKSPTALNYNELFVEKRQKIISNDKIEKDEKEKKDFEEFLNKAAMNKEFTVNKVQVKTSTNNIIKQTDLFPNSVPNKQNVETFENSSFYKDLPEQLKKTDLLVFDDKNPYDFGDMKDPNFFKKFHEAKNSQKSSPKDSPIRIVTKDKELKNNDILTEQVEEGFKNTSESESSYLNKHKKKMNPELYMPTDIAKFLKSDEKK